jgi:hypothetical protein
MATRFGPTKRARLSTWPSVWSLSRPSPSQTIRVSPRSRASRSAIAAAQLGIAIGVEQALARGDDQPGAVAIDRAAFQHPVARRRRDTAILGQPRADRIVAGQVVFAAPAVELEQPRRSVAGDDRAGVAQPDIAEGLDDHLRRIARHGPRGVGRLAIGGDQYHPLAPAIGMDGAGKGQHLLARRLQIFLPQLGMAGKADPHGVMRGPFRRRGRGHGLRGHWTFFLL